MSKNSMSSRVSGFTGNIKPITYESVQISDETPSNKGHISQKKVGLKTISFLFILVFIPLIAFSVVLLWLVFHYRVVPDDSGSSSFSDLQAAPNENEGSYYYINFSATQILFIASWSSTVAPMLVGLVMTLSLFPISRKLFQSSLSGHSNRLPTPYQLAILLGLSDGNKMAWWRFLRYSFRKTRASRSPSLNVSAIIFAIAVIISTSIVIMDTVLHITTKTVSIYETTIVPSPNATLSKIMNSNCANWTSTAHPCTVNVAVTSQGMTYSLEAFKTLNNLSSENQVLQVPTGNATTGNIFLLGPAASQRPLNSDFKATTIGASTNCQLISKLCNLESTEGAYTGFNCTSGYWGNIAGPNYSQLGLIQTSASAAGGGNGNYTSLHNNFGLSVFSDRNLSQPYSINNYTAKSHTASNPFYLGVGGSIYSTSEGLANDTQMVNGGHGGETFVLRCDVHTYDITYSYVNNTISPASVSAVVNNGTVGWNFLGAMAVQQEKLAQLVDLASVQNSSTELALSFANSFSELGVGLLAGSYDSKAVLEQQIRNELLVAKILKAGIWLLVLFNLLFAVVGAGIAIWAFLAAVTGTGNAHALFSVEEVVGMCFEGENFGSRGQMEDRFEEQRVGEMSGRVGVAKRDDGWALHRVNVHGHD